MAVYFIRNEVTGNVKIGYSESVDKRLKQLQDASDCPLKLIAALEGGGELADQYQNDWHAYRLKDKGSYGDGWFSIHVRPTHSGVEISGNKKQRPPVTRSRKTPKANQLCLRLTDHQIQLLRRYVEIKHYNSEVDAVRGMIDGLDDWLKRQSSKSAQTAPKSDVHQSSEHHSAVNMESGSHNSGLISSGAHSGLNSQGIDAPDDAADSDATSPVGDFGGRPFIRLPESNGDPDD